MKKTRIDKLVVLNGITLLISVYDEKSIEPASVIAYFEKHLGSSLDKTVRENRAKMTILINKVKMRNSNNYLEEICNTIDKGLRDEFWGGVLTDAKCLLDNYEKIRRKGGKSNRFVNDKKGIDYDKVIERRGV